MDSKDFFVILNTTNGECTPLMAQEENSNDEPKFATFKTREEANQAAENSILGDMFGYEVFERGLGC